MQIPLNLRDCKFSIKLFQATIVKMFRCVIALILINIYYPSTGHPLKQNVTFTPLLASQLQNLSHTCENSVLSDLIQKQIEHCSSNDPANKKTEFECLMFYDINSQLCTVFRRSKINLEQSYIANMNKIQDIKTICEQAKSWRFTYQTQYPKNEPVDQVFKNEVSCIRICSVDDILSSDSNFFCKYYQWGSQLLLSVASSMTSQNSGVAVPVYADSVLNPVTNKADILINPKIDNGTTSTSESVVKPVGQLSGQHTFGVSEAGVAISNITNQAQAVNETSAVSATQKQHEQDNGHKINEQSVGPDVATLSRAEIEKPPVEEKPKSNEIADDTNVKKIEHTGDAKLDQQVVDIEDQEDEVEDESEYGQAHDQDATMLKPIESNLPADMQKPVNDPGIQLSQQSDGNIPLLNSDPNMDIRLHRNRVGIESIKSVAETFPNPMQDNFTEEDDHFFPFFVTAIIIVVLLYILYHNKNKFTKVILGLLVEGRQSSRRRNSRGHAYRRLDTLEQAMSTNTAAPPSKIIY